MPIKILGAGRQEIEYKTFAFPGGEIGFKLSTEQEHIQTMQRAQGNFQIVARIHDSADLFGLSLVKDAIERIHSDRTAVDLFLPYVPYGRQDRVCVHGEPFSLKVLGRYLNHLHFHNLTTVDPHSDVTVAVIDRLHVIQQAGIIDTWKELREKCRDMVLVSPDAGAIKKSHAIAKCFTGLVCASKDRDLSTGRIKQITIDHPEYLAGKQVICCDDICDGGATFIELAKVCKEAGATRFVLYVTHGIFSRGVDALFNAGVDEIWTTNSYRETYDSRVNVFDLEQI